jgi:uncharacterized protein (TIGR00730 family)
MSHTRTHPFPHSGQDVAAAERTPETPQTLSPAYRLAYMDGAFLTREELRPVRLQLELLKPQLSMDEAGILSTVVVMGSARIPAPDEPEDDAVIETGGGPRPRHRVEAPGLSRYYAEARAFADAITRRSLAQGGREWVVVTGGGPGIMEAGNRGAADAGGRSIGLNIVLPHEQAPNAWVTPELCFNFHYFAIRKMHFLLRARAACFFPGGFGTLDELFETLTLIQTRRMEPIPILLFGRDFWDKIVDWHALVEAGTISRSDLDLFRFVETVDEAMAALPEGATPGS